MAVEETGPGAGVAAADAEHAAYQMHGAELQLRMMEILHQNAVLTHQTAQAQFEALHREGEALRTAIPRYIENYPEAIFDASKPGPQAVVNSLVLHGRQEAAAFTNAFGGDPQENLDHILNSYIGVMQMTPTKVSQAVTEAFVKRAGLVAGRDLQIPQLEGQTKGAEALAAAQGGGAAAEGLTAGAKSANEFHAIQPGGSLVQPGGGAGGAVQPGAAAVQPAVVGGGASGAPALASPAVAAAPTPARPMPAPAPVAAPATAPAAGVQGAPGGARIITPMSPAEAEAQKGTQQQWQTVRAEFRQANTEADKMLQTVEIMGKAQQLATTGMFAQVRTEMQRLVGALGLGNEVNVGNIADNQTFNKAAYQLAIAMTHQLSARPSQLEFTGALSNTPNPEMNPRAAGVLMNNLANAAYHLKDQYEALEMHGARNAFPSGTPNFEGFDQAWAIKNPLSSYSVGQPNHKETPGSAAAGVRMLGFDASGKPVAPGLNPAYVIEYHRTGTGPGDWRPVQTYQ